MKKAIEIKLNDHYAKLTDGSLIRLRRIYSFWLFHANIIQLSYTFGNFYTIFGTNLLIQCPVRVPVCCMFYVSQRTHIKRSPNGIKTDGELFWNIYDFGEVKSTRDGARGSHETGGAPQGGRRALDSLGAPVRRFALLFCRKKDNFMRKI